MEKYVVVCDECGTDQDIHLVGRIPLCSECREEKKIYKDLERNSKKMSLRKVRDDKW